MRILWDRRHQWDEADNCIHCEAVRNLGERESICEKMRPNGVELSLEEIAQYPVLSQNFMLEVESLCETVERLGKFVDVEQLKAMLNLEI